MRHKIELLILSTFFCIVSCTEQPPDPKGKSELEETSSTDSGPMAKAPSKDGSSEVSDPEIAGSTTLVIHSIPKEVAEAFRKKVGQDRRDEFKELAGYLFAGTEPYGVEGDDFQLIPKADFTRFDINGLFGDHDEAKPDVSIIYYFLTPEKDEFLAIFWNGMKFQIAVHGKN